MSLKKKHLEEHILEIFILILQVNFIKIVGREFKELKNIDKRYYSSNFYDVDLNYYGVEVGSSLRFWEEKGLIKKIDPYGWFQWYFRYWKGRRSKDDKRQINRWTKLLVDLLVF